MRNRFHVGCAAMSQRHGEQLGMFHITTNAKGKVPWCTLPGIPEILIDNLVMTRNVLKGQLYSFCILPNHLHIIVSPGKKGISEFMRSFKTNSSRDISLFLRSGGPRTSAASGKEFSGWQKSFYEERIRDGRQCGSVMDYVQRNALRHKLVQESLDWSWTSLHFPHLLDEMEMWLY